MGSKHDVTRKEATEQFEKEKAKKCEERCIKPGNEPQQSTIFLRNDYL